MRKKILNSFLLALLSLAVAQPEDDGVTIEDDNVVIVSIVPVIIYYIYP